MVRQEEAVLVLFRMREVVLRSSLSGNTLMIQPSSTWFRASFRTRCMKFLTYAAPAIRNAMMDMVRDAFTAFEQRMVTEDKDGICCQRVSLDDVLPGEEQLRRIEAIADPYAIQPQSIMEEQESRRELYDGLKRLTQREQTYLLYRYGFTDGEEHPLIGTAIYFHLTKGRAKKTEEQAMDNLWLELPWWFI